MGSPPENDDTIPQPPQEVWTGIPVIRIIKSHNTKEGEEGVETENKRKLTSGCVSVDIPTTAAAPNARSLCSVADRLRDRIPWILSFLVLLCYIANNYGCNHHPNRPIEVTDGKIKENDGVWPRKTHPDCNTDFSTFPIHAVELDEGSFREFKKKNQFTIVNFYASWCVHSRKLDPVWQLFAKRVKEEALPVSVGQVDCMAHTHLCHSSKYYYHEDEDELEASVGIPIVGFPQVPLYKDGKFTTLYNNDHTVDALMQFIKDAQKYHEGDESLFLPLQDVLDDEILNYYPEGNDDVVELNAPRTFYSFVTDPKHRVSVVNINHTSRTNRGWHKFIQDVKKAELPVSIAEVDCMAHPGMSQCYYYASYFLIGHDYSQVYVDGSLKVTFYDVLSDPFNNILTYVRENKLLF